ncbi:hypothetical protein [Xanthomonas vesicatoria]|uniref:DUF3455 domain-containing protein n=1 Tax=Xanthomonas vesicatoria TaxID=56460 RepID=A0AAJ0N473_9XANT|nr:hypothetical protein [Xanthomonas vesicatoria]APO96344.1 hypothetical protein BI313_18715 [Xanthomonas vesicatoria]KHM95022.1 hypothetical protein OR61_10125 [Xanthomonas vesicatoria]KHM96875.1 hypothetical protein OR60_04500 [Xanthomonas vesicatoria]MCC8621705.1 hypothetical protein [Xanthomonas vesicatoria]MCC8694345.1 hypothetical protein [Xanthomonas vesicatoria]
MRTHLATSVCATLLMVLCATACAQNAPAHPMSEVSTRYPVTTATLAGRQIRLGERDGKCAILRDDEVLPLGVRAPCYFSINREHGAQVHHFNGSDIVLVQHAHPTAPGDWDVARHGPICAFESQSVREVDGVLEPGIVANSWHCDPTAGADQKQFVYSYDIWPKHDAQKPARKQRTP